MNNYHLNWNHSLQRLRVTAPTWRVCRSSTSRSWSKRLVSNPARSPSPAVAVALPDNKKVFWKIGDKWKNCIILKQQFILILVLKCENHWFGYTYIRIMTIIKFWYSSWDLGFLQNLKCLCLKGPEGEDGVTVAGGSRCRVSLQAVGSTVRAFHLQYHAIIEAKLTYQLPASQVDILDVHFIAVQQKSELNQINSDSPFHMSYLWMFP